MASPKVTRSMRNVTPGGKPSPVWRTRRDRRTIRGHELLNCRITRMKTNYPNCDRCIWVIRFHSGHWAVHRGPGASNPSQNQPISEPMALRSLDLTGRTAVVIGATSGIGKAIALGLADAGADVVPTGRRAALAAEAAR